MVALSLKQFLAVLGTACPNRSHALFASCCCDSLDLPTYEPQGTWNAFGDRDVLKYLAFVDQHRAEDDVPYQVVSVEQHFPQQQLPKQQAQLPPSESKNDNNQIDGISFPLPPVCTTRPEPPAKDMAKQTCEPRSSLSRPRRPFELELDDSWGATSVSTSELRRAISSDNGNGLISSTSREQIVRHDQPDSPITGKGRKKYTQPPLYSTTVTVRSPSPLSRPEAMGNSQSHHSHAHESSHAVAGAQYSSSEETGSSVDSVLDYSRVRQHKSGGRLSSIGVLKKKPSNNATHKIAATVIAVPRAATAPNLDNIDDVEVDEAEEQPNLPPSKHGKTLSAPSPALASHPGSPDTITEGNAGRPLSVRTTMTTHSRQTATRDEPDDVDVRRTTGTPALSPTIPTPSPLSEDSPHQYGLKDFTDSPLPKATVTSQQAKRRSNGVEMFNDARSLQTAASFLNGLSNARRRAESRVESRAKQHSQGQSSHNLKSSASTSGLYSQHSTSNLSNPALVSSTNLPLAEPPSPTYSSPPLTPKLDNVSRTLGNANKSSGFAYAKALSILQLKCYRKHERLLRSGNTHYPIECAVCHRDEPGDYFFSCSWCAVRMCGGCRTVFRQHGMKALREKIRSAEYGDLAATA